MRFIFLLLFLSFTAYADQKKICLNMIVRNESHVIERCLESVKEWVDYWVIVDTGSTDGTQQIIQKLMSDIPGELHERPWVDFGHNRQEALNLTKGKGDYVLFMDADERLVMADNFQGFEREKDFYSILVRNSERDFLGYSRIFLINNHHPWRWEDILHEYLSIPPGVESSEILTQTACVTDSDGFRAKDPKKYLKDAQVLEKALQKNPNNPRHVFYLAQSYSNAKKHELALKNYERRASMEGGWEMEAFWSHYCAAKLQQFLRKDPKTYLKNYSLAFQKAPFRAEPLFQMAQYFYNEKNYILSYLLSKEALTLPVPSDQMYIEAVVYDYGSLFLFANSAFLLGKQEEAEKACQQLIEKKSLPQEIKLLVENRLLR
jgi:glycosyltransferase involved in cell wall biosynthesis